MVKKLSRTETLDGVEGYAALAIGASAEAFFSLTTHSIPRRFRRRTFGAQKCRWTTSPVNNVFEYDDGRWWTSVDVGGCW